MVLQTNSAVVVSAGMEFDRTYILTTSVDEPIAVHALSRSTEEKSSIGGPYIWNEIIFSEPRSQSKEHTCTPSKTLVWQFIFIRR